MNGNISNTIDTEFRNVKYIGNRDFTLRFLKKSNSLSKFNIKTRLNIIKKITKKDLKYLNIINLI